MLPTDSSFIPKFTNAGMNQEVTNGASKSKKNSKKPECMYFFLSTIHHTSQLHFDFHMHCNSLCKTPKNFFFQNFITAFVSFPVLCIILFSKCCNCCFPSTDLGFICVLELKWLLAYFASYCLRVCGFFVLFGGRDLIMHTQFSTWFLRSLKNSSSPRGFQFFLGVFTPGYILLLVKLNRFRVYLKIVARINTNLYDREENEVVNTYI